MEKKTAKIFFFHFDEDDVREKYQSIGKQLNIEVVFLKEEALGEKIGHIIGLDGFSTLRDSKKEQKNSFDGSFMLFDGIEKERLDEVLLALRAAKMPKVPYKAIVTKTNVNWTLEELLLELQKEHEEMIKFLMKVKKEKAKSGSDLSV